MYNTYNYFCGMLNLFVGILFLYDTITSFFNEIRHNAFLKVYRSTVQKSCQVVLNTQYFKESFLGYIMSISICTSS